ncbi:hypothetical protein A3D80_00365 [Candidatus Roizmanbacteria bacterium RIFCSPHIGHO2_02_FULL_40_13b]|uniref:Uncharacterized protein n=1 Tax=Candidatus Roizmanbacteria bacterium RIFCSPHIGHO2_01_FULL_39_24 TaxID=1802032 RepID=A0A1F7GHJ7_9BACT|nr:MAG: hypothetical protein A2799_03950 [Candidatus Roizmanbacteria bacterium RIFCSPHIGHO2_01_FULL_39_24]OGK26545.1 MAG: hypothetical protein A3D80_00365 [Candidatus Roizmanbacteria bacterium RIFCSPHIGHO2_02_FULL_40_13b]OGK49395.1 MAG: hypothetical protein A3A56_01860 [Candidatus Roizmanbacteria bacterium RIFCSPLOWO2_01_FULL_40_32]OGK56589.1 MAG: hypothetical protein A3H83_03395 [Candidatus Roizmanbacteria bacterium RIFCSPLOWO2_02_FULL_39_8]
MAFIVLFVSWFFFLFFQTTSIYGGDAGDLVTSAFLHGVAHPPGFPLYTFLGFILSKLPILTVAWRVGLLSSLAGAGTITILFLLIKDITKNTKSALIAVAVLAGTYLFWLYSIVPEVFNLHCFFSSTLVYLLYKWSTSRKDRYLSIFALVLGLSLSHHLLTIFLFPAFIYFFHANREKLPKFTPKYLAKKLTLLSLGLTPYLYIFIAASTTPAISWENVTTVQNFLNLVLRRTYGTFQSGPIFAQNFISRLIQFPYMLEFIKTDFTIVGVFLAIIGCIGQFRKRRQLWIYFFLIFLFVGPFYFFYASYYIIDRFSLATFERFLLPSYMIITIWIGEGIIVSYKILTKFTKKQLAPSFYLLFLVLPISLLFINYPKISILKNDRTAENHALDILSTVPQNTILILQYDTTLFDTQYVYFTQKVRPDIKLFHFYKLYQGQLTNQIKKQYPDLIVPSGMKEKFIAKFVSENAKKFPIYINNPIPVNIKDSYWVRLGLLFRFYTKSNLPKTAEIFKENERLWTQYSNPLSGSLGKYNNLMLSNILDFYKDGRLELGRMYEDSQMYDKALFHYLKAQQLEPELDEAPYRMGIVYAKKGNCHKSKEALSTAIAITPSKADYYFSMSQLYKNCFKDLKKASIFEKMYQEKKSATQLPVEKL